MADIFVNQNIRLKVDTENVLTGAAVYVGYARPDGKLGRWTGTIDPSDNNVVYYDVVFTMNGIYKIWAYVVFSGGTIGIGKVRTLKVLSEGQVN